MPRVDGRSEEELHSRAYDETDPLVRSSVGVERRVMPPIIVGLDGSRASGAALRIAAALAERDDAPVEAILLEGVVVAPVSGMSLSVDALRQESIPESTRLGRVRRQLCESVETNACNLHVQFGALGPAIKNLARDTGATLVVLGLRPHHRARRLLGGGAVAQVLQSARIPVLAVPANTTALPHAAVAAIDFSPASLSAARAARDILARPSTLHLVHVRYTPTEDTGEIEEGSSAVYAEGVAIQLERLVSELALDDVKVIPTVETGRATEKLLEIVHDVNAGLVACGATSLNAIERVLLGHIPLELLRRVECSVLIAPRVIA